MNKQCFLIIHGLGGSGSEHWQSWLYRELNQENCHVIYPAFTNPAAPNKNVWMEELSMAIDRIPHGHSLTVIAHSLGCLLWLHYASTQNKQIANKVILVAPPSPRHILPEAFSFFPVPLNRNNLLRAAEDTLFVHSTDDPYCSLEDVTQFNNLNLPSILLPNAGHINIESGHGKWPWILNECELNNRYFNNKKVLI